MSSTSDTTTTDEPSTTDADQDEYDWEIRGRVDGQSVAVVLRKVSHSTYEVGPDGLRVKFRQVREQDNGAYALKRDHKVRGEFDPRATWVPTEVKTAFEVLVGEL